MVKCDECKKDADYCKTVFVHAWTPERLSLVRAFAFCSPACYEVWIKTGDSQDFQEITSEPLKAGDAGFYEAPEGDKNDRDIVIAVHEGFTGVPPTEVYRDLHSTPDAVNKWWRRPGEWGEHPKKEKDS